MIEFLSRMIATFRIQSIIDIGIVAIIVYSLITIIKGTRAEQLSKGIIVLLVLTKLSEWLELYTVYYLLSNLMTMGFLALLIVFQPELRRGLEFIGRSSSIRTSLMSKKSEAQKTVDAIVDAAGSMSRQKIGALIIIERETGLAEIIDTGTMIDGQVSSALLINLFIPNTPLHDGAVVIRNNRVVSAATFLPLTESNTVAAELGTRHRAAIGISERSDCLSIVVSEETGSISVAEHGKISRHLDLAALEKILIGLYGNEDEVSLDSIISRLSGGKKK
ncbi:MAG: diadenylate cyclase CdaA [Tissierellia bacterium]|nr:diadenylate cyclase CdaA [Tissierellia bacterium]